MDTDTEDPTELAHQRTEMAEDRTILANERTFAGWMRTGLAAVGLGLGFNALFGKLEPGWIPRAIATLFVCGGITIFYLAQRNSCAVLTRLDTHNVRPVRGMNLRLVAGMLSTGSLALIAAFWLLDIG